MKLLSTIYSQPSIEELETLVYTFLKLFHIKDVDITDMFHYGVFCSVGTYANHDWETVVLNNPDFEVPYNLYAPMSTEKDRENYVEAAILEVMKEGKPKPGWMTYIEMETSCWPCESQPSNFLKILPKSEEYEELAEALVKFLYSPSRVTVVY